MVQVKLQLCGCDVRLSGPDIAIRVASNASISKMRRDGPTHFIRTQPAPDIFSRLTSGDGLRQGILNTYRCVSVFLPAFPPSVPP